MGGSSKKQTVGYKYYLGLHMILCHGPVDKIIRIRVDGKDAWLGNRRTGRIHINKVDLFGGESREGGIAGDVDFEPGTPTQGVNDYLQSQLGSLVPAFRGVCGVVLRKMYVGMNPYLKKWDFRVSRVLVRQDGLPQWYAQTASIPTLAAFAIPQRILFVLDDSGSMAGTRMEIMKANMLLVLDELSYLAADSSQPTDIAIRTINGYLMARTAVNQAKINELKAFVNGLSIAGGTDFTSSFVYAKSWFSATSEERNNTMCIVTDGEPSPIESFPGTLAEAAPILNYEAPWSGNNEVHVYGVNIDQSNTFYTEQMINTPEVGVPVIDGTDPTALYNAVFFAFMGESPAMNVVHAIRECLTDPDWGMGYLEGDIDEVSFRAAAAQLKAERLGICLLWDRQKPIEDMVTEMQKHANAALYVDRRSGLFKIKLIRDDYNVSTLLHLDEQHVEKVENFKRPTFGELTTSVSVNYWNVATGSSASVSAQDHALAAMQGAPVSTTLQFPGLPDAGMAGRMAALNLRTLSGQYATCDVYADRVARDLNPGDVFKLTWPEYGLQETVMRVLTMGYGNGKSNRIKISCMEDSFAMPAVSPVEPSPPIWENPSTPPKPAEIEMAFELPYFELVQRNGQAAVDQALADNPDLGYVGAAAVSPGGSAINARLYIDKGSGYDDSGLLDFSPGAKLADPLGFLDTTIQLKDMSRLDQVTLGTWVQVGEELMAVVTLNTSTGLMTVKRGVLDTPPLEHVADEEVIFWDEYSSAESTEFIDGETIHVKVAPVSGSGEVPVSSATAMAVALDARAIRPYPPAQVKVNGVYFPTLILSTATLSWVSRNRVQQTGGALLGFEDAIVAAEPGTTYRVRCLTITDVEVLNAGGIPTLTYDIPTGVLSAMRAAGEYGWVELYSERSGYHSRPIRFKIYPAESSGGNLKFEMDDTSAPPVGSSLNFVL